MGALKEVVKRSALETQLAWSSATGSFPTVQMSSVKAITAFDDSHFLTGVEFIRSALLWAPGANIHVWDLGLSPANREFLDRNSSVLSVIDFPFEDFPDFFSMTRPGGNMGWKPALLWQEAADFRGHLIWMDAGNRLIGPIDRLLWLAKGYGFYSPFSSGTVADWTHPMTLQGLGVPDPHLKRRNLHGAISVWDVGSTWARSLLNDWHRAALSRDLLCPAGSDRSNHRRDQALLTCLAYRRGYHAPRSLHYLNRGLRVVTHKDHDLPVGPIEELIAP